MKFVALVSGGKDSIYSIQECCRLGHELLACVHLGAAIPQKNNNKDDGHDELEESYMYQSAASEALVTLVEECLDVPLIYYQRIGKSINTTLVYQEAIVGDEVEDLYQALLLAKEKFPSVQAVSSGAILSTYQRIRIEHVCSRLGLTSLSYLWRAAPQHELLNRMINEGNITAVLVRTACPPGLQPYKHLNKTIKELQPLFIKWNQQYQFHVCGEGGEYESLVLDCPIYKKKLVLDQVQVVELEGDEGVGVLRIIKCHAEEKMNDESNNIDDTTASTDTYCKTRMTAKEGEKEEGPSQQSTAKVSSVETLCTIRYLPRVKFLGGGLWHVSGIMVPSLPKINNPNKSDEEVELAVQEARAVLDLLDAVLKKYDCTAQDVLFVHLYLSEISHFASINAYYRDFFGTLLPPSRSCVAVGRHVLAGGRRVSLDCMVQCGSGDYLRGKRKEMSTSSSSSCYANAALDNTSFQLRKVLHVQSISNWAPVCVGPYSQANTLRSALHFLAGQIGLKPASMTLHSCWKDQLCQCWTNVASVLDALEGGSMEQLLSGVVYVADHIYFGESSAIRDVKSICLNQMNRNGGIIAGRVDSPTAIDSIDNEEIVDDGDNLSSQSYIETTCPLLIVAIPEMPVGAVVEVEVIAAAKAASCLLRKDVELDTSPEDAEPVEASWDAAYDFHLTSSTEKTKVQIDGHMRALGIGCAGIATITARILHGGKFPCKNVDLDPLDVLRKMALVLLSGEKVAAVGVNTTHVLHVRLYYVASNIMNLTGEKIIHDDGGGLRSSLQAVLAAIFQSDAPAYSVVPVQAISHLQTNNCLNMDSETTGILFMALQVIIIDPIQLETELWINEGGQ